MLNHITIMNTFVTDYSIILLDKKIFRNVIPTITSSYKYIRIFYVPMHPVCGNCNNSIIGESVGQGQ